MKQKGFSLIELSVVLVVLALLTGGILGGQALIKASKLRAVGSEFNQWVTAVNAFDLKYSALPGDMRDAEEYWGDGDGAGETWNGNGDGAIELPDDGDEPGEMFTFWQHLALAGMINGEFTGIAGSGSNEHAVAGENVPVSKFDNGGWSAITETWPASDFDLDYGNTLLIGAFTPTWETAGRLFTPEEAWSIDKKHDDGKPGQGAVVSNYWNDGCADAASRTDYGADYKLEEDSAECALFFRKAF